jgi:MerR family transcriptional regulator, redox-sensitive transcriptional activator SoxR
MVCGHVGILEAKVNFMSSGASARTTDLLSIGEVARRAGFAASALRYYETEGLISGRRTGGGQRRYPRSVLRRLAFIRAAQNVGLSLEEVRAALATLPDSRVPTKSDWARLSTVWQGRLDEQIAGLIALRDGLTTCIGCGCLSLRRCALSNPGDIAAGGGAGARYLPPSLRRR